MKGINEFVTIITPEQFRVGIESLHSVIFSVTGSLGIFVANT
jgi:hypothetical protein